MTPELHILGIDPGGTTGWTRLTIPTKSMFGDEPSRIIEWDYGTVSGPETVQALAIARLAREIQSLTYRVGPAIVSEDWDIDPNPHTTDPESLSPVRINAMLALLMDLSAHAKLGAGIDWLGDATFTLQNRTIAKTTATDDRLKTWGLYSKTTHTRDATRQAVVALRRARQDPEFARTLWPYAAQHA